VKRNFHLKFSSITAWKVFVGLEINFWNFNYYKSSFKVESSERNCYCRFARWKKVENEIIAIMWALNRHHL
jgi:hypothetical protein